MSLHIHFFFLFFLRYCLFGVWCFLFAGWVVFVLVGRGRVRFPIDKRITYCGSKIKTAALFVSFLFVLTRRSRTDKGYIHQSIQAKH